jgi:glycerophosphoryl diester phosphodiesterase
MTSTRAQPLRRVGHKGADHIAPGNTRASFDAALAAGVDMIEFDVLPERWEDPGSALLLAHDYADLRSRAPVTLEEGLAHLRAEGFASVELDVDLKGRGYELRVVAALREHRLLHRALISTQYTESLAVLRAAEPAVRLGWSVPRMRRDPFRSRWLLVPAWALLQAYRARLPGAAARAMTAGRCDALMAHWRLVTPRLVRAIGRAGGELYAWTVDDPARIATLETFGVTGVITNDPRLFDQAVAR